MFEALDVSARARVVGRGRGLFGGERALQSGDLAAQRRILRERAGVAGAGVDAAGVAAAGVAMPTVCGVFWNSRTASHASLASASMRPAASARTSGLENQAPSLLGDGLGATGVERVCATIRSKSAASAGFSSRAWGSTSSTARSSASSALHALHSLRCAATRAEPAASSVPNAYSSSRSASRCSLTVK